MIVVPTVSQIADSCAAATEVDRCERVIGVVGSSFHHPIVISAGSLATAVVIDAGIDGCTNMSQLM